MANKNNSSPYNAAGLAFVGCSTAGVGIGLALSEPGAGAVIGTGVGFLVMALMTYRK